MSSTTRTWIAGVLLALSAVVLTLSASPVGIGLRAGIALFALFVHVFIVAVGERACVSRGGLRIRRFPLAPRLIRTDPHLFPQLAVLIGLLWFVVHAMSSDVLVASVVSLVVLAALTVLSVDLLRKVAPFIVPVIALVFALVTMDEFHTLGDLLQTVKSWIDTLLKFMLVAVILLGPTLRTDVTPPYARVGRLAVLLGGLPTYLGALYVLTRMRVGTALGGLERDLLAMALALFAGGLLQTLLVGLFARSGRLHERDPDSVPAVNAHRIGQALMPMLVPLVAFIMLFVMPLESGAKALGEPAAWAGVMALLMWLPLVPAAALVADALDRVDAAGRLADARSPAPADEQRPRRRTRVAAVVLMALWFVLGPTALGFLYADGGPAAALGRVFGTTNPGAPPIATQPSDAHELLLYGLPASDLLRAVTLMLFVSAFLSVRYVRYAVRGVQGVGWRSLLLLLAIQVGASFWLVPRVGPEGAPLAASLGAVVMLAVNVFGQRIRLTAEAAAQLALEQAEEDEAVRLPDSI